jgi:mono/diheme cytochrome c family protein
MRFDAVVRLLLILLIITLILIVAFGCAARLRPVAKSAAISSFAPGTPATGADMYAAYCASCHGKTGQGAGPAAARLKVPPPDLTGLARRNGGRFPGGKVYQIVEWGGAIASHGSREMPVWGVAFRPLSNENQKEVSARIKALTDYLASIQLREAAAE